jgi:hypothetical protein
MTIFFAHIGHGRLSQTYPSTAPARQVMNGSLCSPCMIWLAYAIMDGQQSRMLESDDEAEGHALLGEGPARLLTLRAWFVVALCEACMKCTARI